MPLHPVLISPIYLPIALDSIDPLGLLALWAFPASNPDEIMTCLVSCSTFLSQGDWYSFFQCLILETSLLNLVDSSREEATEPIDIMDDSMREC